MAELLILVVIAGVVLLYAAERARKLRARARQMSAMNERLDVAAAKVDEQQERKQARVRASAELTSVMPAIKRPPLTLPGVPGPAAEPEDEPAAADPEAGAEESPAAPAGPDVAEGPTAGDGPTPRESSAAEDGATARDGVTAGESSAPGEGPAAGDNPPIKDSRATADEVPPEPVRAPEGTLTMGRVNPDATPAPTPEGTPDGTLIMPSVPGQGPAPAAEAALPPAPSRARPRASRPRTGQPRTGQPRPSRPSTSQEQPNRD